ncbi:MAG: CCA tRNA nucleotidyltransferase [Candidatus Izimaplasma sp.]|nr:CCA tRNA nucleotidyltransferase [Candidatus Izimaplasma bacterium]
MILSEQKLIKNLYLQIKSNGILLEGQNEAKKEKFDISSTSNDMLKTAIQLLTELEKIQPNSENLIVGGAVRDLLLGHEPHDIDIASNIDIDKIEKHFKSTDIGKSKDFGIIQVQYGKYLYEIANFRTEEGYSDFRRPDTIKVVNTFEQDAARRDITINALGIDKNGIIYDYVGGIEDLKNNLIKTVGDPFKRFTEDALRLMRIGRFASKYGFKIDPNTKNAITELKHLITKIAPERIKDELFKMASSGGNVLANYIEHLQETGLLNIILPEISKLNDSPHNQEHHPESPHVFGHIMHSLRYSRSKESIVNMAILFHDIGKLVTQSINKNNQISYYGHEGSEGQKLFESIATRLKLTNIEKETILFAIKYHMYLGNFKIMKKSKVLAIRQNQYWNVLKEVMYADTSSRGFTESEDIYNDEMQYIEDLYQQFGNKDQVESKIKSLVDGRKIMQLRPDIKGANIGIVINYIKDYIIENDFQVSQETVNDLIKNYKV